MSVGISPLSLYLYCIGVTYKCPYHIPYYSKVHCKEEVRIVVCCHNIGQFMQSKQRYKKTWDNSVEDFYIFRFQKKSWTEKERLLVMFLEYFSFCWFLVWKQIPWEIVQKKTRETSEQIRPKMGTSDWFYFPDAPSWGHQNFLELYMDVVIFGALKRSS